MPLVKIDQVIESIGYDLRKALEDAVHQVLPQAQFDSHQLFREFKRAVSRECKPWQKVPDHYVELEKEEEMAGKGLMRSTDRTPLR